MSSLIGIRVSVKVNLTLSRPIYVTHSKRVRLLEPHSPILTTTFKSGTVWTSLSKGPRKRSPSKWTSGYLALSSNQIFFAFGSTHPTTAWKLSTPICLCLFEDIVHKIACCHSYDFSCGFYSRTKIVTFKRKSRRWILPAVLYSLLWSSEICIIIIREYRVQLRSINMIFCQSICHTIL